MGVWRRLGTYAGLWWLAAVLTLATVVTAAAAGPVVTRFDDRAVQQRLDDAPYTVRDILVTRQAAANPDLTAEQLRDEVRAALPEVLADVVEAGWGYQRTWVSTGWEGAPVWGGALTGPGVSAAPEQQAPLVSFHYRSDLDEEITLVAGDRPDTEAGYVIEVMVEAGIAETLGVAVGGEYALHPGRVRVSPDPSPPGPPEPAQPVVRVTGTFTADDPAAPAWDHPVGLPLATETVWVPPEATDPKRVRHAGLVTDAGGFAALAGPLLAPHFVPETGARLRLDAHQVDGAWAPEAAQAARALQADPRLRGATVRTGLAGALAEHQRQAAATGSLVALTAAGLTGTGLGLLALVAWLMVERRRDELRLLRARGGAVSTVVVRLAGEALPIVLLSAAAGWWVHHIAVTAAAGPAPPDTVSPPGTWRAAVLPMAAVVLVALVAVPVAGGWAARRTQQGDRPSGRRARRSPARWTVEALVIVAAVTGVVLARERGLTVAGVDPYLSAVPLLLALAAGLVALRVYRAPVRAATVLARPLRGAVGFLALARLGRAAPTGAWALLVLVLAVATAAFAGAVHTGIGQARDAAALQAVGAHLRVSGDPLPPEAVAAVTAVPGVEVVTAAHRGIARTAGTPLTGPQVVAVDLADYQRLLDSLGLAVRLPEELTGTAADGTVPILAGAGVADRDALTVRFAGVDHPATVVGEVPGGVPLLGGERDWVLVPADALSGPLPIHDLLVSGAGAGPDEARAAVVALAAHEVVADSVSVASLAEARAELEQTGFNRALTVAFLAGTVGGVGAAALAVAMWLVGTAAERGRTVSLLRTTGMSQRQGGRLLLGEFAPVTVLAVLTGVACGAATPLLLAPALGLEAFTGGRPVPVVVAPAGAAAAAILVAGLLVAGVGVQAVVNRRRGLGGVLRVG
jgi:putative ABC transport system permease protein